MPPSPPPSPPPAKRLRATAKSKRWTFAAMQAAFEDVLDAQRARLRTRLRARGGDDSDPSGLTMSKGPLRGGQKKASACTVSLLANCVTVELRFDREKQTVRMAFREMAAVHPPMPPLEATSYPFLSATIEERAKPAPNGEKVVIYWEVVDFEGDVDDVLAKFARVVQMNVDLHLQRPSGGGEAS